MRYFALAFWISAAPVAAFADCPAPPNHTAALNDLIITAQIAQNERAVRGLSQKMWELWTDAPDAKAQALLDRGMRQREEYNFLAALKTFDALVDYCPDYAEGYNQRAFVNFLRRNYAPALEDLDRAIALSPRHIAAISGKALTLMGLGQEDEAQSALRDALKLNPWLSERSYLKGDAPEPETEL